MKLKLDKNYTLELRDKGGRIVSTCQFRYEDYELFGNKLDIKLSASKQYYPENNELTISATDVNGLMLKDAKASVIVQTQNIQQSFQPWVSLPDTLLYSNIALNPNAPTYVSIPSSLFQKTNTSYLVSVTVLNGENQRIEKQIEDAHFFSSYNLTSWFSNDSICFGIMKNNISLKNVPTKLRHNGDLKDVDITLPYKEKLNPAYTMISLENEYDKMQFSLGHLNPNIDIKGGIQKDSFNIQLLNPQKLDVSWFIYQGSNVLKKGFGKELDFKSFIDDRTQTFYVEFLYSFGGEDHVFRRQFSIKEEFLEVKLNIPDRVYPGQHVDATISVKDQLGNPVRGVDLTALAVTSKLDYFLPDLPYFGTTSYSREQKAHYSKSNLDKQSAIINLDYRNWCKIAGLDTMKYYQFTYPGSNGFVYSEDIQDSTQFAPYIMQNGSAKEIQVIEVDHVPVYFSWVNQPNKYSFYIEAGKKHEISFRMYNKIIVLDSISFKKGCKTIISFDFDNMPVGTKIHKIQAYLMKSEIDRYSNYISSFEVKGNTCYLEYLSGFTPLFTGQKLNYAYYKTIIVGPVMPGRLTFNEIDGVKTNYMHTGGFAYSFEENIVYKLNAHNLLPEYFNNKSYDPLLKVNDLEMNKKAFLTIKPDEIDRWSPRSINSYDENLKVSILLPYEDAGSGIASIILQDVKTKKTISPCISLLHNSNNNFYNLPLGCHNLAIRYNNGTYIEMDSILFNNHGKKVVDMSHLLLHSYDTKINAWIYNNSNFKTNCIEENQIVKVPEKKYYFSNSLSGNVKGIILDEFDKEPLIGACVVVKGTNIGVVTNIDGQFSININDSRETLIISYVGYQPQEVSVKRGSENTIIMVNDDLKLDEVVVVGYGMSKSSGFSGSFSSVQEAKPIGPDDILEEAVLKDGKQTSSEAEQNLYQELLKMNSFRTHFSDVGFWEPRLFTDKHGESKFNVIFPDDITSWQALVYAMNSSAQTGTAHNSIKSYKPLMAELHVPNFLTKGDSALFLGKLLNYTSDSTISGKVQWSGAKSDFAKKIKFSGFYTDKLPVNVNGIDSVKTRYIFTRDDGYLDGEERIVPVVDQGIIRADGKLSILKNNDEKHIIAPKHQTVTIDILKSQVEIYEAEVDFLLNYKYACNEQLASKLIGLINFQHLMKFKGQPFKYSKDVNIIIERLLKNQNQDFLWSWWDLNPQTSNWMSAHILNALKYAKDGGYNVNLNLVNLFKKAQLKFGFFDENTIENIDLLHSIASWGVKLDYARRIHILDSVICLKERTKIINNRMFAYNYSLLKEKFLLQEIRQMVGLPYQRDSLLNYKKETIMGEMYFSDNKIANYWYNDNLQANIIAYRILKRDSMMQDMLVPIQMYFLSSRKNFGWNTFQSSNLSMSLLSDLLVNETAKTLKTSVIISGKENKTLTKFPFHMELLPDEEINIKKETGMPLFFMQYTKERVLVAKTGLEGFAIRTYFVNDTSFLQAGKPVILRVEVEVKKDASVDQVMVEVPIPASCSYADKNQPYNNFETHREFFKEKTVIFCDKLNAGKYTFDINLLPRFTGKYNINPAQVSLMYVPVVNANTDMKRVEVTE